MLQACFPGYEKLYPVPLKTAKELNIPAVNYGVWGKGLSQMDRADLHAVFFRQTAEIYTQNHSVLF